MHLFMHAWRNGGFLRFLDKAWQSLAGRLLRVGRKFISPAEVLIKLFLIIESRNAERVYFPILRTAAKSLRLIGLSTQRCVKLSVSSMKMAGKFRALEEKMSPEARAWVDKCAKEILREMPLEELRADRQLTQQQLARHTSSKKPKE